MLLSIGLPDVLLLPARVVARRLPLEAESAALGAALQAGAVYSGVSVEDFVRQHPPPLAEEVITPDPSAAGAYADALKRLEESTGRLFS